MITHQGFIDRMRELCNTIELYEEIKKEMIRNHCSLDIILKIDNRIRVNVKEMMDVCGQMNAIDNCNCDVKKGEGCSSPLCPSIYENIYTINNN